MNQRERGWFISSRISFVALTPLIICTERSELVQISKESEGSEVSDNGNRERHAFPLYHFTLLMIKEQNGNRER